MSSASRLFRPPQQNNLASSASKLTSAFFISSRTIHPPTSCAIQFESKAGLHSSPKFFSTSIWSSPAHPQRTLQTNGAFSSASPLTLSQSVRHFSRRAWQAEHEAPHQAARNAWSGRHGWDAEQWCHFHDHWKKGWGGSRHHYHHHHMRKRRTSRFIFRMMLLSTLFVAIPAVVVFDAPKSTLVKVPLTVGAVLGVGMFLTRNLFYVVLPIATVGGAIAFWTFYMPVSSSVKDLEKVLKRDQRDPHASALTLLGPEWRIERARPDEWFRWSFPEAGDAKALDKVDIRMAVFDPSDDDSSVKTKTLEYFDRFTDKKQFQKMQERCRESKKDMVVIDNFNFERRGNHVSIKMEDDGVKIMDQDCSKKYLQLGKIVDRAAKEMESSGHRLGNQVVLVHTNLNDSSWNHWSPYGGLALRIPFDRTWVQDLSDL
ncbi:hypothetical protein BGW38_009345 [Lunasporangiospora selenospora]|uniref:Uncharacterized protein n=1 Tax=Lunasporangiospora selenospora TaxID=979761 RepID=A0A9P6FZE0_9FUNG|nr:hypothetical protein BGW38_009345 [Lunasporangiospora selenospora]